MTLIKVCGLTNLADALTAVEAGADFLGFNFYEKSPRSIQAQDAWEICQELPAAIQKVGIFVDAAEIFVQEVSQLIGLDYLQFHGDETPYYCEQFATPYWKAFRLKDEKSLELMEKYQPDAYLVDAYQPGAWGGTGKVANWDLAVEAKKLGRLVLAGGLNPDNVAEAIAAVEPWCVDVASGVESAPGKKSPEAIEQFIKNARKIAEIIPARR